MNGNKYNAAVCMYAYAVQGEFELTLEFRAKCVVLHMSQSILGCTFNYAKMQVTALASIENN